MRPDDVALLTVPSSPTMHDDLLLVALARPDVEENGYRGGLWRVPVDGAEPRRWTWGDRDTEPVISPDGRWVAFLRVPDGDAEGPLGKPQLHVIPADGGDARRITELPLGAGKAVWSPDSRRIAFTARIPEPGRYGTPVEPGGKAPKSHEEAPRRIDRLDYRLDDIGFLLDRRPRLFVVDPHAERPEPVELTDGRCDVADPAWTPDGSGLVVVTPRDFGVVEGLHSDLCLIPAEGGEPTVVARCAGAAAGPIVTGDGLVVFQGEEFEGLDIDGRNRGVWAVLLHQQGAEPRRLTDPETVDCEIAAGAPVDVGGEVLVAIRNRGAVELRRVPLDADRAPLSELPVVTGEQATVKAFTAHGGRIAAVVSTVDSPGEVVVVTGDTPKTLTDFAAPIRATGLRTPMEITATAPDGYPVHGWLVLPEGPGPHPVLLSVHGGPFSQYGWTFFDEAQVYASAGYAVVLPNPRGSAGYGERHGRAVHRAFGTVDADDVLALLDEALDRPECDRDRVGVMGGSYGGFMTSWLAAHHGDRFRAAWSERALNAIDSFTGSSDIGWEFVEAYFGSDPELATARSPLTFAGKIRIPFMIMHSEQDWRCPVEQAQRMFVALRRNGVPAELLLFPGEGHELSRSGQPRHRVQRFEAVLEWWERHLS